MGFLDILCGSRQALLKIKDPDKIGFDPKKLVSQIAMVVAHAWHMENKEGQAGSTKDGFTASLSRHPDFNQSALRKVETVLQRHQMCDPQIVVDFSALLQKVSIVEISVTKQKFHFLFTIVHYVQGSGAWEHPLTVLKYFVVATFPVWITGVWLLLFPTHPSQEILNP